MSLSLNDSDEDSNYVFEAEISSIKNIIQLLKAVHFREVIILLNLIDYYGTVLNTYDLS